MLGFPITGSHDQRHLGFKIALHRMTDLLRVKDHRLASVKNCKTIYLQSRFT